MHYTVVRRHGLEATNLSDTLAEAPPSDCVGHESGGEQSFVAEVIVDATNVVVVENEEEEHRRTRCAILGLMAAAAMALSAVAIAIKMASNSVAIASLGRSNEQSGSPSPAPTNFHSTFAPTEDSFPKVVQALRPVSGDFLFQEGTSANMALDWIVNRDDLGRDPSDPRFVQRYVMAVLYFSTGGDKWRQCSQEAKLCGYPNKDNFLSDSDECDWFGNDCRNGHIHKIYFGTSVGNKLVGSLPRELAWLSELESIILENNHLFGTIPAAYGRLKKLHTLVATNNHLESPFPNSILDNGIMETIQIDHNNFTGKLPQQFLNQTQLKMLLAKDNDFTGQIHPHIGQLTMLEAFEISRNQFTGTIPDVIASMKSLESFLVDSNDISGLFPPLIFSMGSLRQLNITGNALTGTVPSQIKSFGSALPTRHRKFVLLANNKFHGTVPLEVASIADLNELTLHGNNFTGPCPSALCALKTGQHEKSYSLTLLTSDCSKVDCKCSEACICF
uniref:L domain-like protein n=1 Tax=Odontella aurita TaxID=265563 RepID=A0A7S4MV66_9STRA|mmetsp:Transcript_34796/g.103783  ORF Transcript_34796/g.103783 Transcript_34796/m.103783 type:complete len:503 (+) Transcript_34796:158-1666(+)